MVVLLPTFVLLNWLELPQQEFNYHLYSALCNCLESIPPDRRFIIINLDSPSNAGPTLCSALIMRKSSHPVFCRGGQTRKIRCKIWGTKNLRLDMAVMCESECNSVNVSAFLPLRCQSGPSSPSLYPNGFSTKSLKFPALFLVWILLKILAWFSWPISLARI